MCVLFCVYSEPSFDQFYGLEITIAQITSKFIRNLNSLIDNRFTANHLQLKSLVMVDGVDIENLKFNLTESSPGGHSVSINLFNFKAFYFILER